MKYFITFAAGPPNLYEAGERLKKQAEDIGLFDKVIFYTDADLKADEAFWSKHSEFIENNKRGYGYWIWKPYLIEKTMKEMKDGDILLYLDAGCEIDNRQQKEMNDLFTVVEKDIIFGALVNEMFIEKQFNKMDLLLQLDMLDDIYLNSRQRQSGAIMCYISDKVRTFVNEWIILSSDYHNIDDTPSISHNFDCFIEHRHDQSLFSLLTKKYNLFSNHEIDYYNSCIKYERNRSGISRI
jgi:hypothetical protein